MKKKKKKKKKRKKKKKKKKNLNGRALTKVSERSKLNTFET